MSKSYQVVSIKLFKVERFAIWFFNDFEGLLLDENGLIRSFLERSDLADYALRNSINLEERGLVSFDFDRVMDFTNCPDESSVNCEELLEIWNLCLDIRSSIEGRDMSAENTEHRGIYNKLFFGSNLPSLTPPGKSYHPCWSKSELDELKAVLEDGISLIQRLLR